MKYRFEEMKVYRDTSVKVMFTGTWSMSVVESAIMMIPEVDKSMRPFMNPHNGVVEFTIAAAITRHEAIAAMVDNIAFIGKFGAFINSISDDEIID